MIQMAIAAGLMALLAVVLVMLPVRGRQVRHVEARKSANVVTYREQLAELEADRTRGLIDEDTFASLKLELDRSLLEDASAEATPRHSEIAGHGVLGVAAMVMLLLAGGLYGHLGHWEDVAIVEQLGELRQRFDRGLDSRQQTEALVDQVQSRAEKTPDNDELWVLLAQTSAAIGRNEQSFRAYEKLALKYPKDADAAAYAAQAAYTAAGGTMTPAAASYLQRALSIDPAQSTALALKGMDAFTHQRYPEAIAAWQGMLASSTPGSDEAAMVRAGIRKAQEAMGQTPAVEGAVKVRVALGDGVKVSPEATVFIGARISGQVGRPMLAAKLSVKELPVELVLDQRYALSAARVPLVGEQLDVFARLSSTGAPQAVVGDIEARLSKVQVQSAPAQQVLVLSRALTAEDVAAAAAASSVRARVSLAPGVQAKPDEKIFVVARAVDGPPMPLAVKVLTAGMLPYDVVLSDADAMSPAARISGAEKVVLTAKLSRSGRADPGPGDVLSAPVEWVPGAQGAAADLLIEKTQP